MATTSDISKGAFLRYNGELVMITDYTHITPGKGNAIYTVKSRNVQTGRQSEIRFRSGEKIELVRVETHELQYLYQESDSLICMNQESYEQIPVPMALFGDSLKYLKENTIVLVKFDDEDKPVYAEPPTYVELEVTYTENAVKGDTSSGRVLKAATIETGATVNVPLFVEAGEKIKINATTGEYMERVK
ncbi:elongation factor P [Solitalea koreensis]|uniref:Elongation factor P n=1 Tax=Solitalea koreensis TaxID=543615 RepID=A0A521DCY0_9SPHI|nr:elongation factor P [Solitalea koreensis]SMO69529.1 elongation factor P [Solitalea koreensis]